MAVVEPSSRPVLGVPAGLAVAVEVRGQDWTRPCPSAPLLIGELRRRGEVVHAVRVVVEGVGAPGDLPLVTARGEAVELLRALFDSARPVAWLTPLPGGSGSTSGVAPQLSPGAVAALTAWGQAAGPRRILLAGPRSFCAGVERAIAVVEQVLERHGAPVYVRKQVVHNVHVVRDLERRGAIFVDELDEVPAGATVIFSAHGVSPAVRTDADARGLRVIDATCPLVTKVHNEARRFAERGDTIVLIGHAGHEEAEGTLGEAPDRTVLVQTIADVAELEITGPVSYLTQTTLAVDEAEEIVQALHGRFPQLTGPGTEDICYATTNRQDALRAVAADADLVLVIGSTNSSNSLRLVELSHRCELPAYLIEDVTEIQLDWLHGVKAIGLTAGASAPPRLVTEVVDAVGGLGLTKVTERQVIEETIHFGLPKQVRHATGVPEGDT